MGNYFQDMADEFKKKSNKVEYRSYNTTSTPTQQLPIPKPPILSPQDKLVLNKFVNPYTTPLTNASTPFYKMPAPNQATITQGKGVINKPNFLQSIGNGFMGGVNAADKAIMSIPYGISKLSSDIMSLAPKSIYDPSKNTLLSTLKKPVNYYDNQAIAYNNKNANASQFNKLAGNVAGFIPQAAEMGMELAMPIGKFGKLGDVIGKGVTPLAETGGKLLGKGLASRVATSGLKSGLEMGAYGGLRTGLTGGNLNDMKNEALTYGAGGLVMGAGGKLLGEGLSRLGSKAIEPTFKSARTLEQGKLKPFEPITPKTDNIAPHTTPESLKPILNANGKLKPITNEIVTSTSNMDMKMPNEFTKIKTPKEFKAPTDVNGNLLPDPKIVSSAKLNKTTLKEKWDKFYTATVEKNNETNNFSKLAGNDSAYVKATNSANHQSVANNILENGLMNNNGDKVLGKSLKEVLKDMPKEKVTVTSKIPTNKEYDFKMYKFEKHNIDRARAETNIVEKIDKNGRKYKVTVTKDPTPIIPNHSSEDSAAIVKEIEAIHPEWADKSKDMTKWINDFMEEYSVNSGTLDRKLFEANKKMYPDYIPSNRDFSSLEQIGQGFGNGSSSFANQPMSIKKATGSGRNLIDPSESIANLVMRTVKSSKSNEVMQQVAKDIRSNPVKMIKYGEIVAEPKGNVGNVIRVLENGQPTYIKINNEAFLKNMVGLNKTDITPIEAGLKKITNAQKSLITTNNPIFGAKNTLRDIPTAYINGSVKNPIKFAKNYINAYKDIASKSDVYKQYQAVGGGGGGFYDNSNPTKSIKKLLNNEKLSSKVLKAAPRTIENFNGITESAPRFAEFKHILEKTGSVDKALYGSKELTTNFNRSGDVIKHLDSGILYLNAGVQGLDKMIRQTIKHPVLTVAKGLTSVTIPTLAVLKMNENNPYYKELDNRSKDNNFNIPNTFGEKDANGIPTTFIKIPKTRENGVLFGSLVERSLRAKQGEKDAFKGFGGLSGTIATNFAPANPIENNVFSPLASNIPKNKDFAGRAIVPQGMTKTMGDGRSAYLQFDEKTSEIAKKLGEITKLSPKQIDYIIRSYTGVIGQLGLPLATKTPGKTLPNKLLNSVTSQFTSDPLYSNQEITNFYDNFEKFKEVATNKNIIEKIDPEVLTDEEVVKNNFNTASLAMGEINKQIRATTDETTIKYLRQQLIDIATASNKLDFSLTAKVKKPKSLTTAEKIKYGISVK